MLESLRKTYEFNLPGILFFQFGIYQNSYSSNVGGQWLAFTNSIEETILKDTIVRNSTAFPVLRANDAILQSTKLRKGKVTE